MKAYKNSKSVEVTELAREVLLMLLKERGSYLAEALANHHQKLQTNCEHNKNVCSIARNCTLVMFVEDSMKKKLKKKKIGLDVTGAMRGFTGFV